MKAGRPRVMSRRLSVGLLPEHDQYIELVSQKTGRYEGDIVREALDLLLATKPAKFRRVRRSAR